MRNGRIYSATFTFSDGRKSDALDRLPHDFAFRIVRRMEDLCAGELFDWSVIFACPQCGAHGEADPENEHQCKTKPRR